MPRIRVAVLVILGSLLLVADARALDLKKRYPEFESRKDSLGPITVFIESAVLVDVDGDIKRVEMAESRTLADLAAQSFLEKLSAKGFKIDRAAVASIGSVLNPAATYNIAPSGSAAPDSARLVHAPFYLDSAFTGRPGVEASWGILCRRVLGYVRGNKKTPDYLPEPIQLGDSLGSKVVGLVVINGWRVPRGKQLRQGVLTTLLSAGMVTAHKVSVSRTEFALLDARSGEILWSDFQYAEADVNEDMIRKFVASSTKALP